jgi:arylsulfatase A-like enzyme
LVDGRPAHDPRAFRCYLWDYLGHLPGNLEGDEASMTEDYDQRNRERPLHGLRRLFRDVWRLLDDPELGPLLRRRLPYLDPDIVGRTDLVDLYRLYYGMTTCVDDRVGEMMSMLDGEGLLRDTLIVFTSDHGDMLGSHGLWNKGYVYEEAIRIPLLVRPPGGMAGLTVRDQVAGQVDVMPTVLGLVGLPTPPTVQGADLSAVVVGPAATAGEGAAYIEAHHRQIGVRTRDHLYAIPMLGNLEPDRRPAENTPDHLFFDLRTDPFQLRNLAAAAEAEGVGRDLRDRLLRWRAATPWKRP